MRTRWEYRTLGPSARQFHRKFRIARHYSLMREHCVARLVVSL